MTIPVNFDYEQAVNRQTFSQSDYSYPLTPAVHNIVLTFIDYSYSNSTTRFVRPTSNVAGAVVLPLPSNLQDSYTVKVGEYELGGTGEVFASSLNNTRKTFDDAISDIRAMTNADGGDSLSMSDIASDIASSVRGAARFFRQNFLDSVPGLSGAISVGTGTAVNPHIALNFDGVNLKTHTFSWTLSPENEEESRRIREIIRLINTRMAPSFNDPGAKSGIGRNLMKYPNLVNISFVGINQSYFYYFKPAMISSFTANYAPNGVALNKGGRPSVIQLDMSLSEARIQTQEDFTAAGGSL